MEYISEEEMLISLLNSIHALNELAGKIALQCGETYKYEKYMNFRVTIETASDFWYSSSSDC